MTKNKHSNLDNEIETYELAGEHGVALCYIAIVILCVVAIALNGTGLIDKFINSFA